MVIVALSIALLWAVLITVLNILIPAVTANITRMVPPAHSICIFNWLDVLEWLWTCSASQCCSRTVDCSPGNEFSPVLFIVNSTAEQLSSLDKIRHVIGRMNLV